MNSFFCTIGEKLASKIDAVPNPLLSGDYGDTNYNVGLRFRTIEVQEISDAFAKAKTSKSFGNDNISCYLLKLALPFIEDPLACLFNTCFICLCCKLSHKSIEFYKNSYETLPKTWKLKK